MNPHSPFDNTPSEGPLSAIDHPPSRVLVVDDEKSIRRTLGEFLREAGYEVAEAENADVALQHLSEAEFDVVVSDIILPRVTGVQLLRRMHAIAPHAQVVMMTGEPTVETATEALRAGAVDYLFKPISKAAILRTVANAVRIKSLEDVRRQLEAENRVHRENLERLVDERTGQLQVSEMRARELSRFNQCALDALTAHICILDEHGGILAVNEAWRSFAAKNPPQVANSGVGTNYWAVCEAVTGEDQAAAQTVVQGLRAVTRGEFLEFSFEYACHAPDQPRWFLMRATRFSGEGPARVVVAHENITDRMRAVEAVRESQSLYQSLVEQLPQCVFRKDRTGRFTFVNHRFCEQLGLRADEILGKTDFDLYARELAEKYSKDDTRIMESGQAWTAIERYCPPGLESELIVEVVKWPLRAGTGQVVGVQGIFWDVTIRERSAEILRASEYRLNHAERMAHLGSWESELTSEGDEVRKKLVWSDETYRVFGHEPGAVSVTYERLMEQVHPEDRASVGSAVREALQARRPYRFEHRVVRPDGSERLVVEQAEVVCDASTGRPVRLIGTVQDITDQRRAEDQLRTLARAVEQSPVSIVITDPDGNIEFVNPKFTQVTGYTAEEVLGKNPRFLKSGETPAEEYRKLWETILAGKEWHGEFRNKRKDGTLFSEAVSVCSIRNTAGVITHFIAVKEDLTEKKKLEAQFLRAQRMESIGTLAGGIAHDLNNILAPVLMIVPLLRDTVLEADSRVMLDTVESCAQRGADIIKQLLTFARGASGARVPLPVRHLLRDLDKIIRETFPRDIHLNLNAANDLWPLLGDATQVHQALMNLCVNARDAMPDGGTLTILAKNVMVDATFATMTPEAKVGRYLCLSVSDTGTGIPPENLDRIFDPFFTTKEVGKGTGLGLATVLGIVRGHKGFMRVDSRLGHGTTFDLYLPASPSIRPECVEDQKAASPRGRGELILVVDDEAAVRDSVRRTLEVHGYRVITASHGAEGLAAFSINRASVRAILTDMMMPVMSGPAMINALFALDPHLPILGMTGLPDRKSVKGFERLELPVLLKKPFSSDELLRTLRTTLDT